MLSRSTMGDPVPSLDKAGAAASLTPFTLVAQVTAEIPAIPDGDLAVVSASDLVSSAGSYGSFKIAYASAEGPWTDTYTFRCNQLGEKDVWIQGEASGNYLVVAGTAAVLVEDNNFYCPG